MNTAKPILSATSKLLEEVNSGGDYFLVRAYKEAIRRFGSKADADQLLQFFLKNHDDPYAADLLEIVGALGEVTHAQKIFDHSIRNERLQDDFPEAVLEVLGQLKFENAKPILADYALNSEEYYLNKSAVLGLLNFDCLEYQKDIQQRISNIMGKNLFPEFLPALACKLPEGAERTEILEGLFHSGSTITSTDCNAGIFLAFALCGEEGKTFFKKALFDPNWEAYYNAARTVVEGMYHLHLSFGDLLQEATLITEEKELQYYILVVISLLEIRVKSYEFSGENFEDIYRALFVSKIFPLLAEKAGLQEDAGRVEELLILRMQEEVLFGNKN